jgi:hypothetical protein
MTDAGTHRFPVEATHLLFYARSIGDGGVRNPV